MCKEIMKMNIRSKDDQEKIKIEQIKELLRIWGNGIGNANRKRNTQ